VSYSPQTWVNGAGGGTPLSAARLTIIENGIAAGRSPFVLVASTDMPTSIRDKADYLCDGTNDEVQINSAISDAAPLQVRNATSAAGAKQFGTVLLTGGRFNIGAPILMCTGVHLMGCGQLTELRAVSLTSTAGYPTGAGTAAIIKQNAVTDHVMTVSDMWLNLNFASGGSGHGILWSGPGGSGNQDGYPATGSDPTTFIRNVFIDGGSNAARHAIWLTNNLRAGHYQNIWVRDMEGNGLWADSSPDSTLINADFAGCGTGVRLEGANWRLSSVKTYYSGLSGGNGEGFVIGSGRHTITGIESQDDQFGIVLSGIKNNLAGVTVDCAGTTAFEVAANRNSISSFAIYQRSGGRFATTTTGLLFTGTPTDIQMIGWIEKTNGGTITTPRSGTFTGTRNFIRISDDNFGLFTVG
jgi:hypothetical protein